MLVYLEDSRELSIYFSQWFRKHFKNRAMCGPPSEEPRRDLTFELVVKINEPGVRASLILVYKYFVSTSM